MFQFGLSPPLPYTNEGQGLCHLLGVAEFCGSDFKYVLGMLCNYNELPHRYQDKGCRSCVCLFLCEGVSNLNFCGK